jgi:hypothetical protein
MPHPGLERFSRVLDEDAALREELWDVTEPTAFVASVVRRAAEHGILLVDSDVWEAFNDGRTRWLATQTP